MAAASSSDRTPSLIQSWPAFGTSRRCGRRLQDRNSAWKRSWAIRRSTSATPADRRSTSPKHPLRVGLLLDSPELLKCFAEIVDHIAECNFARLELLVFNAETMSQAAAPPPPRSTIGKTLGKVIDTLRDTRRRQRLLYTL